MADTYLQVIFWALFAMMGIAGIRVVTTRNVVHAALYLVATLLGAASIYILLYAEFVAWVQVLVYVGAVVVLMLFGLMLTKAPIGSANFDNNQRLIAAVCAGLLFAVTSFIMVEAFEGQEIDLPALRAQTFGVSARPSSRSTCCLLRSFPCCYSPRWSAPS